MPISNYLPSSRLIQPGVCTYPTRPASPYEGQVIYETDTRQTLVWNGSGWIMLTDADAPPGLQLIKAEDSITATNASPYGVQSVFTSDYRNYRLVWYASQASANTNLALQMYTGTNTPYTAALHGYGWGGSYATAAPTYYFAAYASTNPSAPDVSFYMGAAIATGYTAHGWLDIYTPQVATSTRFAGQTYSAYTGTYYNTALHGAGGIETTTQFTGFRFTTTAGTTTITYRLYGYRD